MSGLRAATHYTCALKATYEEGNWSTISNLLEVTASEATGECAVSPTVLSFGSVVVGSCSGLTFTITNNGTTVLSGTIGATGAEAAGHAGMVLYGRRFLLGAPGRMSAASEWEHTDRGIGRRSHLRG